LRIAILLIKEVIMLGRDPMARPLPLADFGGSFVMPVAR
jgi:hypothetical protein